MSNVTELDTIEKVARHFAESLCDEDVNYIIAEGCNANIKFHGSMSIRNEYDLWHSHPLTAGWRDNEAGRDIRDGVDYSKDHPDQVSAEVMEMVLKILKERNDRLQK